MIKSKKVQECLANLKRVREFKKHNNYDNNYSFELIDHQPNIHKTRVVQLKKLNDSYSKTQFKNMIRNCIGDDIKSDLDEHILSWRIQMESVGNLLL